MATKSINALADIGVPDGADEMVVYDTSGAVAAKITVTNLASAVVAGASVTSVFGRTGVVTANSGDYDTSQVTESGNLYFTNARAIGATLTGYSAGAGTVAASDSVLEALQKLDGNISAITAPVTSVHGRTGVVVSAVNDYSASEIQLSTGGFTGLLNGVSPTSQAAFDVIDGLTPNGATTQIQYNDAGAFGSSSAFRFQDELVYIGETQIKAGIQVYNSTSGTGASDGFHIVLENSDMLIDNFEGDIIFEKNTVEKMRISDDLQFGGSAGSSGQVLVSGGPGVVPSWQTVAGVGASTFVGLTDTPSTYTGQAGMVLAVNVGETALEFVSAGGDNIYTADGTLTGARSVDLSGNVLNFINNSGFQITNGSNNHSFTASAHTITSAAVKNTPFTSYIDGTDITGIASWAGTPEGNVTADNGTLSLDSSGSAPWYKTGDSSNTGWVQLSDSDTSILTADFTQVANRSHTNGGFTQTFNNAGSWEWNDGAGTLTTVTSSSVSLTDGTTASTSIQKGVIVLDKTAPSTTQGWLEFDDQTDSWGIYSSAGTPEASVTANIGSIATDVTNGAIYVKTTDSANTGWSTVGATTNLDDAYNNFGANQAVINVDKAEGQTTAITFLDSTTSTGDVITVSRTGTTTGGVLRATGNNGVSGNILEATGSSATGTTAYFRNSRVGATGTVLEVLADNATGAPKGVEIDLSSSAGATPISVLTSANTPRVLEVNNGTDVWGVYDNGGTPESVITANIGSLCTDTTNGALYIKTTDSANTGWTQVGAGSTPGIDDVLAVGQVLTTDRVLDTSGNSLRIESGALDGFDLADGSGNSYARFGVSGGIGIVQWGVGTTTSAQHSGKASFNLSNPDDLNGFSMSMSATSSSRYAVQAVTASATDAPFRARNGNASGSILMRLNVTPVSAGFADDRTMTMSPATPESAITAKEGSFHLDATNGEMYVKNTGTGTTGWSKLLRATSETLAAYDDDTAAGVGGLTTGDFYQTTGSGAAPLNAAGIVMIKQ